MKHRPSKAPPQYEHTAEFRFFRELNVFLKPEQRDQNEVYRFNGQPGIKDPIEVFGIPHTEVDRIIVNGTAVGFGYRLQNNDRVEVYPVIEGLSALSGGQLRGALEGNIAFVVDVNLGKLARLLRLLGFDTLYDNAFIDKEIVELSVIQKRVILTRDRRLLFASPIVYGYWVRSVVPIQQLAEVVARFGLSGLVKPFQRCAACNGLINGIEKQEVLHLLEPKTKKYYEIFYRCQNCGKVYWQGSHVDRIYERFARYFP